jgi:hypothetical protein
MQPYNPRIALLRNVCQNAVQSLVYSMYMMEYYSVMNKNEIMLFAAKCTEQESIIR